MKWLLIVLFAAVPPTVVAHAGTFLDDFNDGNLNRWRVTHQIGEPHVSVAIENGNLVLDSRIANEDPLFLGFVQLELRAGIAQNWDSYTLTFHVRFPVELGRASPHFSAAVRKGRGNFNEITLHHMTIWPIDGLVSVGTIRPGARRIPRGELDRRDMEDLVVQNRWYLIKIAAEHSEFEFLFDDNLVSRYEDKTAVPGTVVFQAGNGMLVHVDNVVITGPNIPNIRSPQSVNPEARLATSWGEIKGAPRR